MSVQYAVDSHKGIVWTTFSGVVSHRDPTENALKLRTDPAFDPGFAELIEFRDDSEIHLNYSDFTALAGLYPFSRSSKHAIVVGSRPVIYGIARMFELALRDYCVGIFATVDEALSWLTRHGS